METEKSIFFQLFFGDFRQKIFFFSSKQEKHRQNSRRNGKARENHGQNIAIENIKVVNKKGRITNYGTLSLSNVDFSGNKNGQDGAVVINYYDDLKVENSYFSGNGANRYGGVICNTAYGTISLIDGSVFVENTS